MYCVLCGQCAMSGVAVSTSYTGIYNQCNSSSAILVQYSEPWLGGAQLLRMSVKAAMSMVPAVVLALVDGRARRQIQGTRSNSAL